LFLPFVLETGCLQRSCYCLHATYLFSHPSFLSILGEFLDVESAQAAIRAMAKRVQGTEASRQTYTELKAEDFAAARNLLGVFDTELRHKF